MQTNVKRYEIGGVRIKLEADFGIGEERNFELFEAEFDSFDTVQTLKKTDRLPVPKGEPTISEPTRDIYVEGGRAAIIHRSVLPERRIFAVTELDTAASTVKTLTDADSAWEYENTRVIFRTFEIPHILLMHGGLLLHASMIEYGGQAILFTAPSGVGKSTQAEIWRRTQGADVINGDRALIRFIGGRAHAHGVPYCGSSGICKNVSLPLRAVVSLEQAEENRAVPMSAGKAAAALIGGATAHSWLKSDMERLTDAALRTIKSVPMIKLYCTADERAAKALLNAMQ